MTPIGHKKWRDLAYNFERQEAALNSGPAQTATKSILVYGKDEALLGTRTMVLENAGFRVLSTFDYTDVEAIFRSGDVALVVICHSVSREDCEAVLTLASDRNQTVNTLVLTTSTSQHTEKSPGAILHALDGPRKLVEIVQHLLC